jgi:ABC-2 type transport system ATP-binding protein
LSAVVHIQNLVKRYGSIVAVNDVSFDIEEGTLVGLLGPNGAGKTTLIRMLTTISRPTSGRATVGGYDILHQRKQVRSIIGVVPQDNNLDHFLTARENLVMHARMHYMSPDEYNPQIDRLLDLMQLTSRQNDTPDKYSGGMQRRLTVARALVHDPQVIFLDEPTTGLDPQSRRAVWDYIGPLKGRKTILLTTHYMEEADALADRIIVMDYGKTIADGTAAGLKQSLGKGNTYDIEFRANGGAYFEKLKDLDYVSSPSQTDDMVSFRLRDPRYLKSLLSEIDAEDLLRVTAHEPTLEDVFIKITGRRLRD